MSVEVPSGKGAMDENFLVGSWLIAPALRPHVAAYYAFARAVDDLADNDVLAADEKVRRLRAFGAALSAGTGDPRDFAKAHRLRQTMLAMDVEFRHGLDLVDAFVQDAVKHRYESWAELMDYCNRSAAPVGRFLLDLHGEAREGYGAADALCNALQVLNQLQDGQSDYRTFDRVYLPLDWLLVEGVEAAALDEARASPGLARVIGRCLDGVDALMAEAVTLPARLRNRRLAMESAVIVRLALRLAALLRHGDPVATRIALSRLDFVRCGIGGIGAALLRRGRGAVKRDAAAAHTA